MHCRRFCRLVLRTVGMLDAPGAVFAIKSHPERKSNPAGIQINLLDAAHAVVRLFTYIQLNPMHPQLFTRVGKDAMLVKFAIRDLDEQATHSVKERLMDLAAGIGPIELRLDFEGIESMGSTALAMLVGINRKVAKDNGHVIVLNVADHLVELFHLTRLDTILDIRPRRVNGLNLPRASA